jgi:Family of unknown function (DUF6998)
MKVTRKECNLMPDPIDLVALKDVIQKAKKLAIKYRKLTGKPLGITGEVGEIAAAELLDLKLTAARHPGYDAVDQDGHRIQIKSRCVLPDSKPGQRVGKIRLDYEFDTVLLVLMDENFEPLEIYEANHDDVERELTKEGSKARNVRGSLGVGKFKSVARLVWSRQTSEV